MKSRVRKYHEKHFTGFSHEDQKGTTPDHLIKKMAQLQDWASKEHRFFSFLCYFLHHFFCNILLDRELHNGWGFTSLLLEIQYLA